jgi:hypothetical protein
MTELMLKIGGDAGKHVQKSETWLLSSTLSLVIEEKNSLENGAS